MRYQSGFGNTFSTEAEKGALPLGQNSPQKTPRGLYPEVLSGTAFTAPRAENQSTWLYRLRPTAMHRPFRRISNRLLRSRPRENPAVFLEGLCPLAGSGSPEAQAGIAVHLYRANRSMANRVFSNADGELMLVPQQGALALFTELGGLEGAPGEVAVVPRGIKFKVLVSGPSRG